MKNIITAIVALALFASAASAHHGVGAQQAIVFRDGLGAKRVFFTPPPVFAQRRHVPFRVGVFDPSVTIVTGNERLNFLRLPPPRRQMFFVP